MAYPDFSDSSSSQFKKPQSWSSFTDSDKLIHSNPLLSANPEPLAISPLIGSSSSQFKKPQSWSSFTDSDKLIYSNPLLSANPEPLAISPLIGSSSSQFKKPQTWSSFTESDELIHTNPPLSPPPAWSSSQNNSDHQHDESEDASIHSHSSNKSDKDYVPGSTFTPLITAPNPQSETHTSEHVIQPSQAICMFLHLFKLIIPYSCIISHPPCQFSSLDSCLSKSR